jgi:hypothetical protein
MGTAAIGVAAILLLALVAILAMRRGRARTAPPARADAATRDALTAVSPLCRRMPSALRRELDPVVDRFLERVEFVGCGGLAITPQMQYVVATQAALLVVHRDPAALDALHAVLLYPDEFIATESEEDEHGIVTERRRPLAGQAIDDARIVLSWRDVLEGVDTPGYNVVIHELAHFLDHRSGGVVSAPGDGSAWHATLEREHAALREAVDAGADTLIDPYGAEDPAEFLAVATEAFFEQPTELVQQHAGLYAALSHLYGLDPVRWAAAAPPTRA